MRRITSSRPRLSNGVPVAARQLLAHPLRIAVSAAAVAAAIALVLLLTGLRRGMGDQVTTYLRHQPPVLVGQAGTRDFLSQTSVVAEGTVAGVAAVPGVADASPISAGYAMLSLHRKHVLTVLIGFDPGRRGGPWRVASGRSPRADGELALDRVLAREHGLRVGTTLRFGGRPLRIVGLTRGTSGFMTPLAFTTRATANALNEQPETATFVLVTPARGVSAAAVTRRIGSTTPGVAAVLSSAVAANDRALFVGAFSGPLTAMIVIAAAAAVLLIAMSVYSDTRDRSRDYATLKAIGLSRRGLLRIVAAEAGAVAMVGIVSGTFLAFGAARAIAVVAPKYLISLSARDVLVAGAAGLLFALLAGLVPARYVARLDPSTALRAG
jgi:putative ABC transport system permease protein